MVCLSQCLVSSCQSNLYNKRQIRHLTIAQTDLELHSPHRVISHEQRREKRGLIDIPGDSIARGQTAKINTSSCWCWATQKLQMTSWRFSQNATQAFTVFLTFRFNETKRDYQLMVLFSYQSPPTLGPSSNVEHVCLIPSHTSYFDGNDIVYWKWTKLFVNKFR